MINSISFNRSKIRLMRWVLTALIYFFLVVGSPLPAFATVTQIEEYPGQMLYQSRQSLQDRNGNSWQASLHRRSFANAFKRIHPEGSAVVSLRLVGLSGGLEFDRTQPLTLTTSLGQTLTAKDISSEISQDTPTPGNVAEYDIKLVLSQLEAEIPLHLILPMVTGSAIELQIPSAAIQEWQTIAATINQPRN
jgi:Protein of unknown function (DUF3122)